MGGPFQPEIIDKIRGEYLGEWKGEALLRTKWGFGGVFFPLTRSPRFFTESDSASNSRSNDGSGDPVQPP